MPRGRVQNKAKLTADALLVGSKAALKQPGDPSWIESHPDKDAIMQALRMGASPSGVARMLTEAGPVPVSRMMVDRVLRKIREGKF